MVKFARLNGAFLEGFLTVSKPSRRPITAAKKKKERKGVKGTAKKKNSKLEKPKDVGHFLVHSLPQSLRCFWSAAGIESSGSNHFGHAP